MRGRFRRSMGELIICYFLCLIGIFYEKEKLMFFVVDSVINLTKNSQLYVRQGDVERLIAQGFLERLS